MELLAALRIEVSLDFLQLVGLIMRFNHCSKEKCLYLKLLRINAYV